MTQRKEEKLNLRDVVIKTSVADVLDRVQNDVYDLLDYVCFHEQKTIACDLLKNCNLEMGNSNSDYVRNVSAKYSVHGIAG